MSTYDRTAADALLKKVYEGPIRQQLNYASTYVGLLDNDYESFDGLEVVIPLMTGRDQGVGARAEGGTLPTARNARYAQSRFAVKYLFGRIELSLPLMETMKTNEGAFTKALDSKNKSMTATFKEDIARMAIRNGSSGQGVLAVCDTTTGATQVELATATDITAARMLFKGMFIDIVDNDDDTVLAADREIEAVTANATTGAPESIEISGAPVTTDSTHRIVRSGNWKQELVGLEGIIDDADDNFQNVDTGDHPEWKATVLSNSGTPRGLSEDLMQQLLDRMDVASGSPNVVFLMEYTQRRRYNSLLQGRQRSVNTLELKGGYKALTFNDDIPIVVDKFVPPTTIFAVNRDHLKKYSAADFKWADQDGAVLRAVQNKAAFEAFMYSFCEIATDRRNAHGKIEDLATS